MVVVSVFGESASKGSIPSLSLTVCQQQLKLFRVSVARKVLPPILLNST